MKFGDVLRRSDGVTVVYVTRNQSSAQVKTEDGYAAGPEAVIGFCLDTGRAAVPRNWPAGKTCLVINLDDKAEWEVVS